MAALIDLHHPVTICRASAGTGKTYTLAAYYVGLLLSGEDYRSILAVTFTNKATAEMSERILGYLYGIAQGGERPFLKRARQFMLRDTQLPDSELEKRADACFRKMLLDYDNVQVMTIDSFLQTLLAGLAGVLKMNAGLNTELDIDHIIRQAVEQLLTIDMTPADRSILEDYMRLKLDEESQWDVRNSLCAMAKELYNESVQMLDADHRILFDTQAIAERRKIIRDLWDNCPELQQLRTLLASCNPEKYNRYTLYAYERLQRSVANPEKMPAADRFRGVSSKSCNADEMAEATELAARVGRYYNTLQLTVRFSRDMELMTSLQTLINRNLDEANSALLARTAGTLSKALREGDADFILEKAGIRYRHVLIDEFQDTSRLQWSVIRQLLLDVLAGAGHTLLIVGDIKQSIYRWRNGDWHIMDSLDYPNINEQFTSLTRNFRSSEEVVRFNLSLFKHIIAHYESTGPNEQKLIERIYDEGFRPEDLEQFYQADRKKGGHVRFRAFPKRRSSATPDDAPSNPVSTRELMVRDMFDEIESLLQKGAQPSDIMILVREKKEAAFITDLKSALTGLRSDVSDNQYPCLSKVSIVSADSFLLEASEAVRIVIAALRFVARNDKVAAKFIELNTDVPDSIGQIRQRITPGTPLYEAVSELVSLLLTDTDGRYKGTETAYINSLLDRTRAYVSTYGSSMEDFLTYWDDTLHAKPIPASATDAIRILTVHASKGLQSQTLFVPFCTWTKETGQHPQKIWCQVPESIDENGDFVPIQDGAEMQDSDYRHDYNAEHMNLRIDNLNMLYVALTRAEDNLYVSADFPITTKGAMGTCNRVGRYLLDYLDMNGEILREDLPLTGDNAPYAEYAVGTPVIRRQTAPNAVMPAKNVQDNSKPFSFSGTPSTYAELWSNSDQVRFVQSQEGAMYTDYGEEAYRRVARMDFGSLCHDIFAHLRKADELDMVLDDFETRGLIASGAQREELKSLISSAWKGSDEMRDWFTAPWQLKLEQSIYIDQRELRPDRVMINPDTNEAIVLDYKFGVWEDRYAQQVRDYMEALRRMDYTRVRGYLWFARNNKLIEITPNP